VTDDVPARADPADFKSVYGRLMAAGAPGLSPHQEAALRDLDGIMLTAEHVISGVPVGAGAHSAICALLMDAYTKGQRSATGEAAFYDDDDVPVGSSGES
jgi:hypothetical protein